MAQRWHWLRLRTTCHATEDLQRVKQALQTASGLEAEPFAAALEEMPVDSHHGGRVVLLDLTLERSREIRHCLGLVWTAQARDALQPEVDARTDDHGVFHFRVGKQAAYEGTLQLTAGDDAIQLRLKPEVHPSSREAAVAAVEAALQE